MDWQLSVAIILVIGATLIALLALGNRVLLARAIERSHRRADMLSEELTKARKAADDRQANDTETISRLQSRIQQQGQLMRTLQEDLDKFISQHHAMVELSRQSPGPETPKAREAAAAADQRERAIREKLRSMLHEFRSVTGGLGDGEAGSKAA